MKHPRELKSHLLGVRSAALFTLTTAVTLATLATLSTVVAAQAQATPDSAAAADSLASDSLASASLAVLPAPQGRRVLSWTADRRAFVEGDLLSVFVDEQVIAAASADDFASDDRRMGRGASIGSSRISARLDADTRSDERGVSNRNERFRTEITVRVLEIQGGNLRVEGKKNFQVDDHEQEVVLRGWVRPNDVSGMNIIDAWRVADLEFLYVSNGELIKPKQGMLQKLLGIVF